MFTAILVTLALGQAPDCSSGQCIPQRYEWRDVANDAGKALYLVPSNRQIGYLRTTGEYLSYNGSTFTPSSCPANPPVQEAQTTWETDGVNTQKIKEYNKSTTVSKLQSIVAERSGSIPDRSKQLQVSVLTDTKEHRDEVRAELKNSALNQKYRVRVENIEDPIVAGLGYVLAGPKTLQIQTPDGTVLHRAEYVSEAQAIETARKADAKYDPSKDPDLNAGGSLDEFLKKLGIPPAFAAMLVAVLTFILGKKLNTKETK